MIAAAAAAAEASVRRDCPGTGLGSTFHNAWFAAGTAQEALLAPETVDTLSGVPLDQCGAATKD